MKQLLLRSLPESQRVAIAHNAIGAVKNGMPEAKVAVMYGTTPMTIHRWVTKGIDGDMHYKKKGRPAEDPNHVTVQKPSYEIDLRQLTDAQRMAVREASVQKVKAGEPLNATSLKFGVSMLTLSRWIHTEGESPKKKGRKLHGHNNVISIPHKWGRKPRLKTALNA